VNEKEIDLKQSVKGGKYENLILEEDRKKGKVETTVYKEYFMMCGGFFFFLPFIFTLIS
jgi:hypothetical protein